jgi:hypothetical protein
MQTRWLKILVVLGCVLSIVGIGYALTQVTFQNTSTILAGQNMFITQPVTVAPTSCPADGNVAYTNRPTSVAWILTAGSSAQNYYFCIDNQGSAPDAVSITSSLSAGACPATGNTLVYGGATNAPTSLAGHTATATPVTISVCAGGAMAPTATGPTFFRLRYLETD